MLQEGHQYSQLRHHRDLSDTVLQTKQHTGAGQSGGLPGLALVEEDPNLGES